MNKNIKIIFSDLFGVLIGPNYKELISYIHTKTNMDKSDLYDLLFDEDSMRFLRKEINLYQYFMRIQYKVSNGSKLNFKHFERLYQCMQIGELPVLNILLEKKSKYKLAIISNTSQKHIQVLKKQYSFFNFFESIITSDLCHSMKPDDNIFLYACNVMQVEPNESIFIDRFSLKTFLGNSICSNLSL